MNKGDKKCIAFAEWLRINFNNTPEEFDNYWEDLYYTIHNTQQKCYTTEELFKWWTDNVAS